ncbi:MAG: hypothetical protein PHC88_15175 [Terrimicrobiaceae bacterium]|nr:hypothetical protein [Terrimicrobiaceae bacterium]
MFALAIPLGGVVWFARGYLGSRLETTRQARENPAFRSALEKAAATSLEAGPIADGRPTIEARVADAARKQKAQLLKDMVTKLGGTVVELETERRFLVSAPSGSFDAVRRTLGGSANNQAAPASAGEFFEVLFR